MTKGGGISLTASQKKALKIAEAISEKKGYDIVLMELEGLTLIADYFLLASGRSRTQVQALAHNVLEKMAEEGINELRVEGKNEGRWVLLDYGDVVVHIFQEEDRSFYNLERLWSGAKLIKYEEVEAKAEAVD